MSEGHSSLNSNKGTHSCCGTGNLKKPELGAVAIPRQIRAGDGHDQHGIEQILVPKQRFLMGDVHGDGYRTDGETPLHAVTVEAFMIDSTSVTNDDFRKFVDCTGYVTEAELFGVSAVFHQLIAADKEDTISQPPLTPWWLGVKGVNWTHPYGKHSSIEGLENHPVVHVSWNDAIAYCQWANRALPTEAQWEAASRGGREAQRYPWGNQLHSSDGKWNMNIWQGEFPVRNTMEDGFLGTAPVHSYSPNDYGLWQTVGNVWEWCQDIFSRHTYALDAAQGVVHEPQGPAEGAARVLRGGSYLCHESYCNRARNAARWSNTPDSSMGNTGFRTVSKSCVNAT